MAGAVAHPRHPDPPRRNRTRRLRCGPARPPRPALVDRLRGGLRALGPVLRGDPLPALHRRRHLEQQQRRRLGPRHRLLRLVDRHRLRQPRPGRYPAPDGDVTGGRVRARGDQPPGRGQCPAVHDRGRALPDHPSRAAVVLLLEPALPQHPRPVAAIPLAPGLGRHRHRQLPRGHGEPLVRRAPAGPRDPARPGLRGGAGDVRARRAAAALADAAGAGLRDRRRRLARLRLPLAALGAGLSHHRPARHPARGLAPDRSLGDAGGLRAAGLARHASCPSPSWSTRSSPGSPSSPPWRCWSARSTASRPSSPLRHAEILARLLLGLGLASLYGYAAELLSGFLHGDAYARATLVRRFTGAACLGGLDGADLRRCCRSSCSGGRGSGARPWPWPSSAASWRWAPMPTTSWCWW